MSVICSGDRPPSPGEREEEREEKEGEEEGEVYIKEDSGSERERGEMVEDCREKKRGKVGREAGEGRGVERWLTRQESDSPLIGSIGHCQRRVFSCSLTGRAVRMIAHLSAQKTNKNKPLLI